MSAKLELVVLETFGNDHKNLTLYIYDEQPNSTKWNIQMMSCHGIPLWYAISASLLEDRVSPVKELLKR